MFNLSKVQNKILKKTHKILKILIKLTTKSHKNKQDKILA